jgi:hypothetical protein
MRQQIGSFLILVLTLAPAVAPVPGFAAQQPAGGQAAEPPPYAPPAPAADSQAPAAAESPAAAQAPAAAAAPAASPAPAAAEAPATSPAPAAAAADGSASATTTPAAAAANPQPQKAAQTTGTIKQWVQEHPRSRKATIMGALGGALGGALVAARTGRSIIGGAVVGAVVGGLAGFLIGRNQDKIFAGRDEAVRQANYDPSQGYVMRIDSISFEPANAKPGESATLSVRYLVIGPDPHEKITVNCFRGIKYQDNYVMGDGPSAFVVPHGGGIVTTSSKITIPKDAPAGTYAVEAMFDDPGGRFQQSKTSPLYIAS